MQVAACAGMVDYFDAVAPIMVARIYLHPNAVPWSTPCSRG